MITLWQLNSEYVQSLQSAGTIPTTPYVLTDLLSIRCWSCICRMLQCELVGRTKQSQLTHTSFQSRVFPGTMLRWKCFVRWKYLSHRDVLCDNNNVDCWWHCAVVSVVVAHRRKSHRGHVLRENWTAGDSVALCPPKFSSVNGVFGVNATLCTCHWKWFKPLQRTITQFLKLKAKASSDELLIVAQSMPVSRCCGWLGHGYLSCIASRDAAAARTMACRGDLLLQFQSGYT